MNERIRELYLQAHTTRHYDGDPALDGNPPTVYWQDEVSAQRFAELIIKECADYVRTNYDSWDAEPLAFNMEKDFGLHGDYAE